MTHLAQGFKLTALLAAAVLLISAPSYAAPRKVYTAKEILAARQLNKKTPKAKYCTQNPNFKPCVCWNKVTPRVQYRPAVKECPGHSAAIILSGSYLNAYSSVVRNFENQDRYPKEGINNCSAYERDDLGLNKCSAYKVQEVIGIEDPVADAEIHCLGGSGYGPLFKKVNRITIKLANIPDSTDDPLVRLCIKGPNLPLN